MVTGFMTKGRGAGRKVIPVRGRQETGSPKVRASRSDRADILVPNVSVRLLRSQRAWLLRTHRPGTDKDADGLVNMLDYMIDKAEGYE